MKNLLNRVILIALLLIGPITIYAQTKIDGNIVSDAITVSKKKLILNGGGTRTKYMMSMYVGTLYLTQKNTDAEKIIMADEPMCIRLKIVSGLISSSKMEEAVDEGFKKSTGNNTALIKSRIQQFMSPFKEEINTGDEFEIAYTPEDGMIISKNGVQKIFLKGLDFKQATFRIWLGKDPADEDLRKGMLGN